MKLSRKREDIFTIRQTFAAVFVLCVLSTLVFLYSAITIQTFAIGELLQDTFQNLTRWRNDIHGWVENLEDYNSIACSIRQGDLFSSEHVTNTTAVDSPVEVLMSTTTTDVPKPNPILTLFTTWQTETEKYTCRNNTVKNWSSFKPNIRPILFTNENLLAKDVNEKGWSTLPIRQQHYGIPVLKFMYMDAKQVSKTPFYAYTNGDILFTLTLLRTLMTVVNSAVVPKDKPILIVGRRTNVQNVTVSEANSFENVSSTAKKRGKLFNAGAEDYFITSEDYPWKDIPEVVIGRVAYDNWLVFNARKQKHTTIDATLTLLALHQTTKSGNHEGRKSHHPDYNRSLLRRLYKQLNYGAGFTSCTKYLTKYDNAMNIKVERRKKTC